MRGTILAGIALLAGCGGSVISPLKNKLAIGEEPYVVFVGDAPNGHADLFAVSTGGGPIHQVTFSRVDESLPALSPDGTRLVFARAGLTDESAGVRLWVMNLENGGEKELPELSADAVPTRLAWNDSGNRIYLVAETDTMVINLESEEMTRAAAGEGAAALTVRIGPEPGQGVMPCGKNLCLEADTGAVRIVDHAAAPLRWGADSLGYLRLDRLEVRPLAGGKVRIVPWADPPPNPRQPTLFFTPRKRS